MRVPSRPARLNQQRGRPGAATISAVGQGSNTIPTARFRRFRDLPLFWKLLVPFFTLMLILGVVGAFLIVRDLSLRAKTALDEDVARRSLDTRSLIHDRELSLLEAANLAANLQGMPQAVSRRDAQTSARLLQSVLALKSDLTLVVAADQRGVGVVEFRRTSAGGGAERRSGTHWESAPFVSELLRDPSGKKTSGILRVDGRPVLAIASPICSEAPACASVGIAIAGIDADFLVRDALVKVQPPRSAALGIIVYDTSGAQLAASGLRPAAASLPTVTDASVTLLGRAGKHRVETLYAPLDVQGRRIGTLAVSIRADPAFSSVNGTGVRLGLFLLAAMAGVVAIGALLSRRILAQLRPLVETNRALGSGDLSARVPVLGGDELGEVAHGVNQMAEQLQASIETLESRVEQRTQEVQRLLQDRTEFFASLSHELRTPLAVILSQAELLKDPSVRRRPDGVREIISDSARQLLTLVNEILELARAEVGAIELRLEELSLPQAIRPLRGTIEGLTRAAGLKLSVDVPRTLPPVKADPDRLREVLLNLVDNAVKYTPPGGSVRLAAAARNGKVTVSVADSGTGIPAEVGDRVFEPFFRVPGTKPHGGQASSGLGLALTKRLVEAHGGEVWFESDPDRGSTFHFTIPSARRRARTRR